MQRLIKSAIHVATALCAYLLAFQLVVWPDAAWWLSTASIMTLGLAALYATLATAFELLLSSERSSWRYVSIHDAFDLSRTTVLTAVTFLVVSFLLFRAQEIPRTVFLLAPMLHLGGLASARMIRRVAHERSLVRALAPMLHRPPLGGTRLLLIGNVGVADSFLRELARDQRPDYAPVAIIGLTNADKGQVVRGVPVRGAVADLECVVQALASEGRPVAALLFLSPPDVIQDVSAETLGRLKSEGLTLLRLPVISELSAAQKSLPSALRELSVEELLARPTVQLDASRIYELVNGKRVLVTGAGGSIGSEICRQVAAFGCAHLSMLDHSEFQLFKIDQETQVAHPALSRREMVCDVRDPRRVLACITAESPDIIFHAAALKHVPIVENHPAEGLLTNVVGTWNVAEAARQIGVRQMVMISTDKAVDPNNVMGATKRLAEAAVRGQHGRSRTLFSVVRFGNVLGSTGSVVPTFQAQIERGGPVTITHPDVERYFMTIPEAVQLVLHATAESASRDLSQPSVFVLDMGAPVKILDLAKTMIALHGLKVGQDIGIEIVGLRPGEKLTEELIDTNERVLGRVDSVIEVVDKGRSKSLSASQVRELDGVARSGDDDAVRQLVYAHVAELRCLAEERVAG